MADATVEWSQNIDFTPLLTAVNGFLESAKPLVEFLSGTFSDFYTTVLLPLASWTLEKGLPELLQVFIDFNNKVDWEKLRSELQTLWEHVEPFMETVGEGLVIFIGDVSDAVANFANSETFKSFLEAIEKWMDSVDAEDVANGLKLICEAIIGYKLVSTAVTGLTAAKAFINIWTAGKGAQVASEMTTASKGITTLADALNSLTFTVGVVETFKGALEQFNKLKNFETMTTNAKDNASAIDDLKNKYEDGEITIEEYNYELGVLIVREKNLKW